MRKRLAIGSIVSRFVRLWYSVLAHLGLPTAFIGVSSGVIPEDTED